MADIHEQLVSFCHQHPERIMRVYKNLTGPQKTVLWEVEFETVEEPAQWLIHRYGDLDEEIKGFWWFLPLANRTGALKGRELYRLAD
jgi:hypothetical protein